MGLRLWEQILPLSISFLICETEIKYTYVVGFCHLWLIFTNIHWILFPITHFTSFQRAYSKIGLTRSRPWDKIYMEVICKGILLEETYNKVVEMPKGKEPSKVWLQAKFYLLWSCRNLRSAEITLQRPLCSGSQSWAFTPLNQSLSSVCLRRHRILIFCA